MRRRLLLPTLVAATLAALGAPASPAAAAPGEATNYLVDAAHSSSQPTGGPSGTVAQRWSRTLGLHVDYALVAAGRVFALASDTGASGAQGDDVVHALDASTGATLWQRAFGEDTRIAYDASTVYVSWQHGLVALDARTGHTRWIAPAGALVRAPITAGDGVVALADTTNQRIRVFDGADGHLLWQREAHYPLTPLTLAAGRLYTYPGSGALETYDARTGAPRWSAPIQAGTMEDAAPVFGGRLWVPTDPRSDGSGQTFDAATGAAGAGFTASVPPAFDADGAYLRLGSTVLAVSAPGATPRWSFTGDGKLTGTLVTAGGRVWTASSDGRLYGLDPQTGAVGLQLPLGAPYGDGDAGSNRLLRWTSMSAGGGLLLVPAAGTLVAFSGADPVAGAAPPDPPATVPTTSDPGAQDAVAERQDAHRSGVADGAPAPPLAQRWTRAIDGYSDHAVILGDRAFLLESPYATRHATRLTAIRLTDGRTLWSHVVPALEPREVDERARLAAADGRVFVSDPHGGTYAFAAADGAALWTAHEYDLKSRPVQAVLPSGGVVYSVWEDTAAARNAATGQRIWTTRASAADSEPILSGGRLLLDHPCGAPTAIDLATGDPAPPFAGDDGACSPDRASSLLRVGDRLVDDVVRSASDGRALDATATGVRAAGHGMVVTAASRTLLGQDVAGLLRWRLPTASPSYAAPLIGAAHAFHADAERLAAVGLADGAVVWQEPATNTMELVGGRGVLLRLDNAAQQGMAGTLTAYEAAGAAPRAHLDGPAPRPTRGSLAPVAFSLPAGTSAQCAADAAAWAPCASPWTPPSGLAEGEHRLAVRAVPAGGGAAGAPVATLATVDRTPPQTVIEDGAPVTTRSGEQFADFRATEPARFTCALDDAAPAPCIPPFNYIMRGEGRHRLTVQATDEAGNAEPVTPRTITLDLTAPALSIDPVPASTTAASVVLRFHSEAGATFECVVDSGPAQPCASPFTAVAPAQAFHTVYVTATDAVGNWTSSSIGWQRTTQDPWVAISEGETSHDVATRTMRFGVGGSAGISRLECRVDDEAWAACANPYERTGLAEGAHVAWVRDADVPTRTGSHPFVVDWTGPSITLTRVVPTQTRSSVAEFALRVDSEPGLFPRGSCFIDDQPQNCWPVMRGEALKPGEHVLRGQWEDEWGNRSAPFEHRWTQLPAPADPDEPAFVSVPPAQTSSTTAEIVTRGGFAGSECRVDDGAWQPCSSRTVEGLAVGAHVAELRKPGTTTASSTYRWTILPPPAPPTGVTATATALREVTTRFTLGARQIAACEIDEDFYGFHSCASPDVTYVAPDGYRHTSTVLAIDRFGTPSAPASARFTALDDPADPSTSPPSDPGTDDPPSTDPPTTDPPTTDPPTTDPPSTDPPSSPGGGATPPLPTGPLAPVRVPATAAPATPAAAPGTVLATARPATLAGALRAATARPASDRRSVVVALRPPAAGRVRLTLAQGRTTLATGAATARSAGAPLHTTLRATAAGRRLLARHGPVRVSLRARLGGATASRAVTLRR